MTISPITPRKQQSLTWSEFEVLFRPIKNHLVSDPDQQMFETYGEEDDFVRSKPITNIWTYVDVDNGTATYNGYHWVNRIGYFITEVPWDEEVDYEIDLDLNTCEKCGEVMDYPCQEDDGEYTCPTCCGHEECE